MEAYDICGMFLYLIASAIAMEHSDLASPMIRSVSFGSFYKMEESRVSRQELVSTFPSWGQAWAMKCGS